MTRSFYRIAGPIKREYHELREVLVPRDESLGFTVERARKERNLFREVAAVRTADGDVIAKLATKTGPLGRIPQISQAEAASVVGIVRMHTRESLVKLAARKDLPPLELLATAIAQSAESAFAGLPKTRKAKAMSTRSLAAAVLAEPLVRIEIEAIEVLLRAVRGWDPAEGPKGLVLRGADVLRGRALTLSQSETLERRATAAVLADLADALDSYARVMSPPALAARDGLIELKRKVMAEPAPTDKDWGQPLPASDEDDSKYEGDPVALMVRLTLDLWTRFQEEPSSQMWSLPTAPLWSAIWVVAPFLFTAMEKVPGWGPCIHETTDDWHRFGRECHAWAGAVDALRAYEQRATEPGQLAVVEQVNELLIQLRGVLGTSAPYAAQIAATAKGNERNTLERLLEMRMEAAAIAVLPVRIKILGTEGRALASIQAALGRDLTARRCDGLGCRNVLSTDAAPQTRKCKDCTREQARKRQTRHRARSRVSAIGGPGSGTAVTHGTLALRPRMHVLAQGMVTSSTRRAPEVEGPPGGRRGTRHRQHDGTRPVKEQAPSKGGER